MRRTVLYRDDGDVEDLFHVVYDDGDHGDEEDMSLIECRLVTLACIRICCILHIVQYQN